MRLYFNLWEWSISCYVIGSAINLNKILFFILMHYFFMCLMSVRLTNGIKKIIYFSTASRSFLNKKFLKKSSWIFNLKNSFSSLHSMSFNWNLKNWLWRAKKNFYRKWKWSSCEKEKKEGKLRLKINLIAVNGSFPLDNIKKIETP